MKSILFDSSTLICMALTCSLHALEKLRADYDGDFVITNAVKAETIDKASQTLRFKYEGCRLQNLVQGRTLTVYDDSKYRQAAGGLGRLANSCFFAWGRPIKIIHPGEISLLAIAKQEGADAIAVDERSTRLLVEAPEHVQQLLQNKLHTDIKIDKRNLDELKGKLAGLRIIRSIDLALVAFKKGYLGKPTKNLLEGVLWALKFAGSAVSGSEIKQYLSF